MLEKNRLLVYDFDHVELADPDRHDWSDVGGQEESSGGCMRADQRQIMDERSRCFTPAATFLRGREQKRRHHDCSPQRKRQLLVSRPQSGLQDDGHSAP